ncbi:sigma-70 family RNA polymerase sigma factor [Calycomorphotria hydatis]|uniref:RNA polymerase sigma factor RpoE n=1 Tax=Calycomorphotria hydatis TaxID=2528027 RepID=A0A517TFE7_9PLAN|nr:sigma-70 family RNA polymerase sigma factor [Calycomorphotria hydatis]QDT67088.1 RNA polymerase sigma factor RpoE [Calycomorphotria hydatis]
MRTTGSKSLDHRVEYPIDSEEHSTFLKHLESAYASVFSLVNAIVGSPSDVDDVMQDVLVVLWQKYAEFDADRNFGRWARGVAINVARNFCRKKRYNRKLAFSDEAIHEIARMHSGSSELLELHGEQLDKCVKQLNKDDQRFLWECFTPDKSLNQLAREKKCPPSSLYSRLSRLRQRIYGCMNRALQRSDG